MKNFHISVWFKSFLRLTLVDFVDISLKQMFLDFLLNLPLLRGCVGNKRKFSVTKLWFDGNLGTNSLTELHISYMPWWIQLLDFIIMM